MRPEPTNSENAEESPMSVEMTAPSSEPSESGELPDIDDLRLEIDRLDAEILAAVRRRTEVSQIIGKIRMASGGTRLVHSREMKVIERYSELGPEGRELAMLLLRLGRGRLGH
ncbi:chorismate mutase [Mycolicibacterium palauense]|uniref:chorismate mutase n=1 Tax=Mycolicibacterium palauense TaxID=2034511 RepID=UPI000BFEE863|nr:chorismate mutase [Mycolicibacterium palauense]